MGLLARFGEFDLALALAVAAFLFFGGAAVAVGATHAQPVQWRLAVLGAERVAARAAEAATAAASNATKRMASRFTS